MSLTILPAIDLKGGRCVRLRQGRADDVSVYGDDPAAMARHWVREGAEYLHVVDLDGAFEGRPRHWEEVSRIVAAAGVPVELGGGLRTDADIEQALKAGVARVILGTRACGEPQVVKRLAEQFGDRLAIGIDARDGLVQVRGWTETTELRTVDLAQRMADLGVATLIVTDTARDGMLEGVNTEAMADVCAAVSCSVIASGGISSTSDIEALRNLMPRPPDGAIVGKALYEGRVSVSDLKKAAAFTPAPSP